MSTFKVDVEVLLPETHAWAGWTFNPFGTGLYNQTRMARTFHDTYFCGPYSSDNIQWLDSVCDADFALIS